MKKRISPFFTQGCSDTMHPRSAMRLPIPIVLLALAFAPAAGLGDARAQDMINNTPDYIGAWYLGDIMRYRGDEDEGRKKTRQPDEDRKMSVEEEQPSGSGVAPSTLLKQATYAPSKQVTAALDAAFAGFLAGGQRTGASSPGLLRALAMDNPPGSPFARLLAKRLGGGTQEEILRTLEAGKLQHEYAQWLSSMGYSDTNLFDVHTAFLMHSWAIANKGTMTADSNAAFRAVRDELVEMQSGPDAPRTMATSNAKKQEEAQSFALLTALLVSAWQEADAQDKSVLRAGVASLGRRIGIDYGKVVLTSDGFSTR